ncbi:polysaccharide deacetylase family protein [Lederbergia citrea]|uniref:Polysaccharide deacetylase family protein n=1 Tax=Lederbergia citrea TaxID=2833581 RepID=A0A942URW3_9BACI|nr:polysaccharide deacetylase family protein [Lederbergia citrea]MBS4223643.1 polysaccharide deacetylase family protein [Lederbergia citrea]
MNSPQIYRGNPDKQHFALTFDDGPNKLPLENWLEALEQCGAPGTFFFTGEWIDKNPEKAREIIARGHELAPHSYHHRRMGEIPKNVFFEEMKLTELAYQEATGSPCPTFFRFPYLHFREENLNWLTELGYVDIEGDDSRDWAGITSQQIIDNSKPFLKNGTILVFHANDIAKDTPGAIKPLIRSGIEKGLKPVKISEILEGLSAPPSHRKWKISIDVPVVDNEYTIQEWKPIHSSEDLHQLALETMDWGIAQTPSGMDSEQKWLKHLSESLVINGVVEDRQLFSGWYMADHYWGYARLAIDGEELILLDFATREAQADALVYLLRWAAKTATDLGCKRISATRDMRRLEKMCQQLGWKSNIELDKSLVSQ